MAKVRKPIPKTQKEISINQHEAYDTTRKNPNVSLDSNESQTGIPFKRSEKISFKEDTSKPLVIGLEDIDKALFYYFDNIIQPNINQNGNLIKVPIIYSSPERWKSYRKDGYYRDKDGAFMLPIIVIKKESIDKDRSLLNKLDANDSKLYTNFQKTFNNKNIYSNFSVLNNRIPTKQMHAVVIPDYLKITYSCIIQTYYMSQLNKIMEAIEYASDSYWGEPERFKFKAIINSFKPDIQISEGKDRLVKGTFSLQLNGYIIPDVIQKDLNSIKKFNTKSKFIVQMETTYNSDIFKSDITKLPDGRTRKKRNIGGRITNLGEITPGREIQSPDPGSELRS